MNRTVLGFLLSVMLLLPTLGLAQGSKNAALIPYAKDLVVLQNGKLISFKADTFLSARYTIIYFGAGWCPDCRHFSPTLVQSYNRQPKNGERFEVLLVSRDETEAAMQQFMASEQMTWPALSFAKAGNSELEKYYSGHGTPCLTVIDQSGRVILQSQSDQDAKEVLRQLQGLLTSKEQSGVTAH